MKRLLAPALSVLLLSALAGCGRVRYPSYYTLHLQAPVDPPAAEGIRTSIAVREFQSPTYLRQGPIVYRSSPEQVGFYEYHRWASDPRAVVTNAVVDHLRASGQYSAVSNYNGRADDDYVFSGRLEQLEEVDSETGVTVEVAMSAQITRLKTGDTIWSNTVSEVEPVSKRSVTGVVSQMNATVEVAINKLLATIPSTSSPER